MFPSKYMNDKVKAEEKKCAKKDNDKKNEAKKISEKINKKTYTAQGTTGELLQKSQ